MRRIGPIPVLLALSISYLGACGGDGTTPPEDELGGLEPLAVSDSVEALADPLMAARTVSQNFLMALEDLREGGVEFRRFGDPARVTFPPEFLGRVFRYEATSGGWIPDDSRTGAPADGVRVLWYRLDGSGQVELPAQEMGHIDLTDGDDPGLEQLRIHGVEVRTSADNIDLVDFVQGYATEPAPTFEAAGSYSDGTRVVDFTIDSEQGAGAGSQEYTVTVTLQDGPVLYELRAEGTGSVPGGGFQDAMRATVDLGSDRTVLDLEISGVGPQREASGTITFNGAILARVAADGTLYTFSNSDGAALSATSSSELNIMVRTLLLAGLEPFTWLPLELP